jgi:peptidoglycan/xylan/chitin deacetylase (PgdA/CDA1 family)
MYHHIQTESLVLSRLTVSLRSFKRQISWLSQKGYETISLEQLGGYILGQDTLPKRPVIITFDDGYQSVWDYAKPVLDQTGFTATVFLVAQAIGKQNIWDLQKSIPILPCMDKATCRRLLDDGWEVGSHGLNHYALPELGSKALIEELTGSKNALEQLFNCQVTAFCYPHGAWNKRIQEHVKSIIGGTYTIFHKKSLADFKNYKYKEVLQNMSKGKIYVPDWPKGYSNFLDNRKNLQPHIDFMVDTFTFSYAIIDSNDISWNDMNDIEKICINQIGKENLHNIRVGTSDNFVIKHIGNNTIIDYFKTTV